MIKIYHNPRCRKSREGLSYLQSKTDDFTIVEYLKNPPSVDELKQLIDALGIKPESLVRKKEDIFKTTFKGKSLSDAEWIEALHTHPKLIERPIIIKNGKAVIGRPANNIDQLF